MTTFDVADDVYGIDVEMFESKVTSAFLVDTVEPTLIDAGTAKGVDQLLDGIREVGVAPSELESIIVSHIHIDHCGGAGVLVEEAPDATVYIHESTSEHLVEPNKLVKSSKQVMGKHFEDMGAPKPVPEERITTVSETRTQLDVGSRSLELVHTPGHSPDHLAVCDSETGVLFANEGIGEYLPSAKTWLPPATLPNFDIKTVKESIGRLRNLDPSILAFAHFGEWDSDPEAAFDTALDRLVYFDERIPEIHEETRDVELTIRRVRSELLDLEPAYGEDVGSFYASLQTKGFLKANGKL